MNGELVAQTPADSLVLGGGAPIYDREYKEPGYIKQVNAFDASSIEVPEDIVEAAHKVFSHINVASKKWVTNQYDSMVGTVNMSTNKPTDAGIINLKDSDKAIAVTVDCNARYVNSNPERGCAIAVAEAARNIICSGGNPSAITNCLNFGNPYSPEAYWQFVGAIKGMTLACEKFETPVTGGNVSFYNQSTIDGVTVPVMPTPTIGMIGIVDSKKHITPLAIHSSDHKLYLIGEHSDDMGSSEYLISYHNVEHSPAPTMDIDVEWSLQNNLRSAIRNRLIESAHDASDGGLFTALVEMTLPNEIGFEIDIDSDLRIDGVLLGEAQSRIVVAIDPENEMAFTELMKELEQPISYLGVTGGDSCIINEISYGSITELNEMSQSTMPNYMAN